MLDANNKTITRRGWYLYDFANSILIINGSLYFPQWIVNSPNNVGDLWFNLAFVVSSIFLIITAPVLGLSADYRNSPFRYLSFTSFFLVLGGIGVGISPFIDSQVTRVTLALSSFFIVIISYQLSLVFYNAILGRVAQKGEYETVSGRALAWGWIGGIVAVFLGLPFSLEYVPYASTLGGMGSILPSAIITAILIVVSLRMIARAAVVSEPAAASTATEGGSFWAELGSLRRNTVAVFFLLGFFFYSDAILTLQNNSTIYMNAVIGLADDKIAYLFVLVLLTGALGALASIPLIRKLGLKRSLLWVLIAWVVSVALTPFFVAPLAFAIAFGIIGLLNGVVWNVSRVLFFHVAPKFRKSTYFGFYSTFERFASILGPLVWSLPVTLLSAEGAIRYQIAWGSMALFLLIGIFFIAKLPQQEYFDKRSSIKKI